MIDKLFSYLVSRRILIINIFKIIYILLALFYMIGASIILTQNVLSLLFYQLALGAGRTALVLFIITLIPGIAARFGFHHKIISLLRIFRRYIGILMYLFTFIHFSFLRLFPTIASNYLAPFALFEISSLTALFILFFLFITSNDLSVRLLKINWYRIHRAIYIAMFFIFFHVALQRFSIWTALMGTTLIIMIISFFYSYIKFKKLPYQM